ncbi:hypothetical protein A8F94_12990 [Bacillus sp. FJAT-27225]|uniref:ABC transporter permease n=1 Tax=Bacillus sp. FJAT-27225 TaxID=1743144 RepID=UPI00080C2C21|nr:ABC transporter permease [Bacillus sp. FJAT-27225]OCA85783.1 hypothetical protein A8F94_12990 [Bacillus sp. FJAT-27225]
MIIWNEIKKLFEWKAIVLLFLISVLMYQLFLSFDIKYFPNGRPSLDVYNISADMIRDYGTSMDDEEFKDFKSSLSGNIEEAEKYLQSKEEFVKAGITTYDEYKNLNVWDDPEASKLHGIAIFEDNVDAFWEIQAKQGLIEDYEEKGYLLNWHPVGGNPTEKEKDRLTKIAHSGAIFPSVVFSNYNNLISSMCVLVLLSIMFLVSPLFIRDRNNKMIYLHYSSKIGRKLFKKKLAAALIGAFIITTVQLGAFFILYSKNGTGIFLNSNINSVSNPWLFWLDYTFMQYILASVFVIYLLGFFIAIVIGILSRYLPNYISMIGAEIVLAFIMISFVMKYFVSSFGGITMPIVFGPLVYCILLVSAMAVAVYFIKKERKQEILN